MRLRGASTFAERGTLRRAGCIDFKRKAIKKTGIYLFKVTPVLVCRVTNATTVFIK